VETQQGYEVVAVWYDSSLFFDRQPLIIEDLNLQVISFQLSTSQCYEWGFGKRMSAFSKYDNKQQ